MRSPFVLEKIIYSFFFLVCAGFLLKANGVVAQDFSLCSVVDAKHKTLTLAWNRPAQDVTGYSFFYNSHELTPFAPTVDGGDQLAYTTEVGLGRHEFRVNGFDTALATNEVFVRLKRPRYLTILVPGLYQAVYRNRYATTCGGSRRTLSEVMDVVEPVMLIASAGFATSLWIRFLAHRSAALNAREAYITTIQGAEFDLWQQERQKASDLFPLALKVSIGVAAVHVVSVFFFSPRVRARINGGFQLDCKAHPGGVNLCVKL